MRPPDGDRAYLRRYTLPGVFLWALLVAHGLSAQGPRFLRDSTFAADPIQVLLDRSGELRLTAEQTSHLKKVQGQLHATNDPLVAQLVTIRHRVPAAGRPRDMNPEQRQEFREAVQRARPIMQAIGRNNVEAMGQVGAVLTPAQKELVRGWIRHTDTPPGLMPHGGPGPRSGAGCRWVGPALSWRAVR